MLSARASRIIFGGLILAILLFALGVADFYRMARTEWVLADGAWECLDVGCGDSPPVIQSRWRAHRAAFGFGVLAVCAITAFFALVANRTAPGSSSAR
jgi:hypothetical protein